MLGGAVGTTHYVSVQVRQIFKNVGFACFAHQKKFLQVVEHPFDQFYPVLGFLFEMLLLLPAICKNH